MSLLVVRIIKGGKINSMSQDSDWREGTHKAWNDLTLGLISTFIIFQSCVLGHFLGLSQSSEKQITFKYNYWKYYKYSL